MNARKLNLLVLTLLLGFCAMLTRPDPEQSVPDKPKSDATASKVMTVSDFSGWDWWGWTSSGLMPSRQLPAEPFDFHPGADLASLDPSLYDDDNSRCWALELLGRSDRSEAVDIVKPYTEGQPWNVRAAARLALGRLGAYELATQGLNDTEIITVFEDERRVGEGGSALYVQPVVLATLKGLISNKPDPESLPYLLTGLRAHPLEQVSYDNTPEPFPDTVTRSNPAWYREALAGDVRELGWSALPALQAELEKPDSTLVEVTGGYGRDRVMHGGNQETVHQQIRVWAPGLE